MGGMGSLKDFFKIWTKRNSTARKLPYRSLMGTTSDLYGAKEEKESAVPSDSCNLSKSVGKGFRVVQSKSGARDKEITTAGTEDKMKILFGLPS